MPHVFYLCKRRHEGRLFSHNGNAWKTACRQASAIPYTDSMLVQLIDSRPLELDFTTRIQIQ